MQKFGVREICEVVLKAKATTKIGNKVFYKNEPVMYFDTLKTSSLEGAATTVYAQGGRGNSRLVAWEGERTLTFTMEDALISPEGMMILTGAGLIDATKTKPVYQHVIETTDEFVVDESGDVTVYIDNKPYLPIDGKDNFAYVMAVSADADMSEPFIPEHGEDAAALVEDENSAYNGKYALKISSTERDNYVDAEKKYIASSASVAFGSADHVIIDYYVEKTSGARQIDITPDKFGGNYYLEASTLFRNQDGVDLPAEFIIPNCKVQSNFTFTMASSGDPSTFTFTMDAFPDYTRFDRSKKVLCALQIIDSAGASSLIRESTVHSSEHDSYFD